jgi:ATP-dependent Lhr-like helicase
LAHFASALGVSEIRGEGCCYITFKATREEGHRLLSALGDLLASAPPTAEALVSESEAPCFEKYDEFIPAPLLRRAFFTDRLNVDEVIKRFC